jgi:phospholipase A2
MEYTPFEIGSEFLGSFIPTWSFGREFKNGKSIDNAPEQTLGYHLGIYGSAFTVSINEIKKELPSILGTKFFDVAKKLIPKHVTDWMSKHKKIDDARFSPAEINNFCANLKGIPQQSDALLTLGDAGFAFNLPFPPLMRKERNINIIIACDASATIENAPALKGAEAYAREKGLKFPRINYDGLATRSISIFKDETDPSVPVVIYIPWIKSIVYQHSKNKKFCNTTNFAYKPGQFEALRKAMEDSVTSNKALIVNEIKSWVEKKQKSVKSGTTATAAIPQAETTSVTEVI